MYKKEPDIRIHSALALPPFPLSGFFLRFALAVDPLSPPAASDEGLLLALAVDVGVLAEEEAEAVACDESGRGVVDPAGLLVAALGFDSSSLSSPKSKFSASCFNKRAFSSINSFKALAQKVSN